MPYRTLGECVGAKDLSSCIHRAEGCLARVGFVLPTVENRSVADSGSKKSPYFAIWAVYLSTTVAPYLHNAIKARSRPTPTALALGNFPARVRPRRARIRGTSGASGAVVNAVSR